MSTLSKSKKFLLVERTHGVSFGLCLDVIMNTHRSNVIFGISNVIFIAIKKENHPSMWGVYNWGPYKQTCKLHESIKTLTDHKVDIQSNKVLKKNNLSSGVVFSVDHLLLHCPIVYDLWTLCSTCLTSLGLCCKG